MKGLVFTMKVATIVPTKFIEITDGDDYQMSLAHLIGADPFYTNHFKLQSVGGAFIIMDNGAAENAQVPTVDDLYHKAMEIGASEIVLPDTLFDHEDTIRKAHEAIDRLMQLGWTGKLMAVPHGSTQEGWIAAATVLMQWQPVTTIGISKFLCKQWGPYAKAWALSMITHIGSVASHVDPKKAIHLLGCWGDPMEVAWLDNAFQHLNIRGVDSAIAYVYAQKGLKMNAGVPRPEDEVEFTDPNLELNMGLLMHNVGVWRQYGKQAVR
jgi:hypothetical protein